MQKDTPMGKAYAKAKGAGTPPPPPPPPTKGAGGDNADVATRRYKNFQNKVYNDTLGKYSVNVVYDSVNNALRANIINNNNNKKVFEKTWHEASLDQKNWGKFTASVGRAITKNSRENTNSNAANLEDVDSLIAYLQNYTVDKIPNDNPGEPNAMNLPPGVNGNVLPKGYKA
jgi:hypothetical protein